MLPVSASLWMEVTSRFMTRTTNQSRNYLCIVQSYIICLYFSYNRIFLWTGSAALLTIEQSSIMIESKKKRKFQSLIQAICSQFPFNVSPIFELRIPTIHGLSSNIIATLQSSQTQCPPQQSNTSRGLKGLLIPDSKSSILNMTNCKINLWTPLLNGWWINF